LSRYREGYRLFCFQAFGEARQKHARFGFYSTNLPLPICPATSEPATIFRMHSDELSSRQLQRLLLSVRRRVRFFDELMRRMQMRKMPTVDPLRIRVHDVQKAAKILLDEIDWMEKKKKHAESQPPAPPY
jgi:hypothetical protein